MKNKYFLYEHLSFRGEIISNMKRKKEWFGCFGVQSFIQHSFLSLIEAKYGLFRLLHVIRCRTDRCCLERIIGLIFFQECPILLKKPSLLGSIHSYMGWGYTIEEYNRDARLKESRLSLLPLVKVWTGR